MAHLMDIPSLPSLSMEATAPSRFQDAVSLPTTAMSLPAVAPAAVPTPLAPSQPSEAPAAAAAAAPAATALPRDTSPPSTPSPPSKPTRAAMQDELNQHSQQMSALKDSLASMQAQQENLLRTFNTAVNDMETRLEEKMQTALAPMAAVQEQSAGLRASVTKLQSAARTRKMVKLLLFLLLLAGALYFIVTSRKAKQGAATTATATTATAAFPGSTFHRGEGRMLSPPRSSPGPRQDEGTGSPSAAGSRRARPVGEPAKRTRSYRREPLPRPSRRPPSPRPAAMDVSEPASSEAHEGLGGNYEDEGN